MIPAAVRHIIPDLPSTDELLPFLRRIDDNRWYSNFGPLVQEFEARFVTSMAAAHKEHADYIATTTLTSCYHALAIGLKILGVKPGDKVLIPSITFPACPLAVQHIGAEPVLADIDATSWSLTPTIARAIAAKNKIAAVMPVAVYGAPEPAAEWDAFTKETGIPVIIDAAAAVESQLYPRHCLVAHSLHALKPFGIGEGGLLVSANPDLIDQAREYSNFGMRNRIGYGPGENAKLSEYHAAVGLAQLQRWEGIKARRKAHYALYQKYLAPISSFAKAYIGLKDAVICTFMLQLSKGYAPDVAEQLKAKGIAAHRTYLPPLYTHPYYAELAVANSEGRILYSPDNAAKAKFMPVTEGLNNSVIGLPFHHFMPEQDVRAAVDALAALQP